MLAAILLSCSILSSSPTATNTVIKVAVDSPNYMNPAWRDSVANYQGRLEAYHQEFYSYDWGMTFAMLPVIGEWYVNKTGTGIAYSAARLGALAVGTVGAIRLIGGKPNLGLNIGLLAGGIVGWFLLKWSEVSDVRHTISHLDENLVDKFGIVTPDIIPHSIRYPTKEWPDWVTSDPPARHPQDSKEAVNTPLPSASKSR